MNSHSKTVSLRRREIHNHYPPEVVANSKRRLGSAWVGQSVLRPVEEGFDEVEFVAKGLLGIRENDQDYSQRMKEYWADKFIDVSSDGEELEIGLGPDGKPIDLEAYVNWCWAKAHPKVALSRDELNANPTKMFWLHDYEAERRKEHAGAKYRQNAYQKLSEITMNTETSADVLRQILRVLSDMSPDRLELSDMETMADQFASSNPKRFLDVASDPKLPVRSFIKDLITHSIVRTIGNQLYFGEEMLGADMDQAIAYLSNEKTNSQTIVALKGKLAEAKNQRG